MSASYNHNSSTNFHDITPTHTPLLCLSPNLHTPHYHYPTHRCSLVFAHLVALRQEKDEAERKLRELREIDAWWVDVQSRWQYLKEVDEADGRVREARERVERWEEVWGGLGSGE
jgi:hypothetical protein